MKIIILGAAGMAGHMIYSVLEKTEKHQLLGTVNSTKFKDQNLYLNIHDLDRLNGIIDGFQPEIVINCIGILIKGSKSYPDEAIYANSYFPNYLAKLSRKKKFKLIHISTDCVFSGREGHYSEDSIKDATDLYGLSKSLGEIKDDNNLTIRTSIIGPEIKENGEGLFDWFMRQEGKIYGYKSNIWSGVTTLELANFIKYVINDIFSLNGLIHLTNNQPISKFDLLSTINEVYKKGVEISDEKNYVCDKSFINTNEQLKYTVPSYIEMIEDQKKIMLAHRKTYSHYFR